MFGQPCITLTKLIVDFKNIWGTRNEYNKYFEDYSDNKKCHMPGSVLSRGKWDAYNYYKWHHFSAPDNLKSV